MTGDHMEDYMGLCGALRSTILKYRMGGDDKLLVLEALLTLDGEDGELLLEGFQEDLE
ncbi:hypothetical protein MWSIV6_1467 [Methanothermobacter wolfeii]|nr:hypothetical protein MWSIV6_1467 [Methanothermobacter wolfeii]